MIDEITEIAYKDGFNWVSVDGTVTDWTNAAKKFKDERTQPYYVAPIIVVDEWNGEEIQVQHEKYDSYFLEFNYKESEVRDIEIMKSCSQISVVTHTLVDGVFNRSKEFVVDTQRADSFEISEPERAADTTGWVVNIIFKINKTYIDKTKPTSTSVGISIDGTNYYSNYDLIPYYQDNESVTIEWPDGEDRVLQSISKTGSEILLYMSTELVPNFLAKLVRANSITINGTAVLEYEYEKSPIGVGMTRIVIKCVTTINVNNFISFSLYNVTINDGVNPPWIFYTDYEPYYIAETPEITSFDNGEGVNNSVKSITKLVKQAKFFLNESDAFNLKRRFEKGGTITLSGDSVLENRNIAPDKIGVDLYEVSVDCLLETDF